MTSIKTSRLAAAVFALLLVSVPVHAGKRRAVGVNPPPNETTLTGTVLDAVTGQPVRSVKVSAGTKSDTTDSSGKFSIRHVVLPASVVAERSGYESKTIEVTGAQAVEFRLQPLPTVTVRTTDGVTRQIDFESIRFGYTLPFAGYVDHEYEDFCKPDGTAVQVDRAEMKRLVGPATSVQSAPCCTESNILKIRVELKTGEASDMSFVDSCQGYVVDLIGREHTTGKYEYFKFTEVAEVVFP